MTEEALQAAVLSLEASTAAFNRQAAILRTQTKFLNSSKDEAFERIHRSRTKQLESQNLNLVVEDSYQALTLELDELEEGLRDQINQSGSLLSSYLRQDDYTLQRLAADSVLDVDNEHVSTTKVENLTAKLSAVICEEFQFRLNRVYLQHLVEGTDDQDHDQIGLEEQELETDLDSLHVEISDVAAMSIFQDFKAPLLRTLADEQNKKTSHAQAVLERTRDSMATLTEAARTCLSRFERLRSYQLAILAYRQEFDNAAQNFASEVDARRDERHREKGTQSPARDGLLSHWNVHIPEKASIEQALWFRKQKLEQDVQRAGTAVADALHAHLNLLPTNTERLLEMGINAEKDLGELEQEMGKLKDAVERVNLASIGNEDRARAGFLARWAENR